MRTLPIAAILLASSVVHADPRVTTLAPTCADVAPDGLDQAERERTQQVLARALEQADVFVVDRDCAETYRVAYQHEMVVLQGPHTTLREARSPNVGNQLAELIVRERAYVPPPPPPVAPEHEEAAPEHEEVATAEPEVDEYEANATTTAQPPQQTSLLYARVGMGGVANVDTASGFGLGFRVGTPKNVDVDLAIGFMGQQTYGKLQVLTSPAANRAGAYIGGGISISTVHGNTEDNSGLGAELSAGLSMTDSHRWFLQGDLSLPFYGVEGTYPATAAISVGYAFAKM